MNETGSGPQTYQYVVIELNDGSKASFFGKTLCNKGDPREVVKISFTKPTALPPGSEVVVADER